MRVWQNGKDLGSGVSHTGVQIPVETQHRVTWGKLPVLVKPGDALCTSQRWENSLK